MDKLTYLYNLEIKRNQRICILIISAICFNIFLAIYTNFKEYEYILTKYNEELVGILNIVRYENIIDIKVIFLINLGIIISVIYSFKIWSRDFNKKNKSIYTLMIIPESRMSIYYAKLMTMLTFIYLMVISIITTLYLAYSIFSSEMLEIVKSGFVADVILSTIGVGLIPQSIQQLVVIYLIFMPAILTSIFFMILMNKYITKYKMIISIMFIIANLVVLIILFISTNNIILSITTYSVLGFLIYNRLSKHLLIEKIDF